MPRTCNVAEKEKEILRLWKKGESINAISTMCGHGYYTVKRRLEKNGIDTSKRRYASSWTAEQDQRLIIGRNSGRTGQDLYGSVPGKTALAGMQRLVKLRRERRRDVR